MLLGGKKNRSILLCSAQTSTPAGSFMEKRDTPDSSNTSTPGKFQRARFSRTASTDSLDASEEDHRLPYRWEAPEGRGWVVPSA